MTPEAHLQSANNRKIQRIVILGGGMTGWTVAAGLANGLSSKPSNKLTNPAIDILLINNPAQTEIDMHHEPTTPACIAFHQSLGISEWDLVAKTGASFLLATEFEGWSDPQQQYFMPFSDHGFMLNGIEFSQYVANQHLNGNRLNYDDFSLAAVAAKKGRFFHPSAQGSSIFSTLQYGLVLNTKRYAEYLRAYSLARGVKEINAEANEILLDEQRFIKAIGLKGAHAENRTNLVDDKGLLEADLFIDCSGNVAELIEKSLQVEWAGLQNSFPDAVTDSPITHVVTSVQPLTKGDAIPVSCKLNNAEAGWVHTSATQTHIERQYYFHRDYLSVELAHEQLGSDASLTRLHEVRLGRRLKFWHNNCVAIGAAACNPGALVVGKIHLVQSAVLRLLNLFPAKFNAVFNPAEYNRLTHLELDHIEDFHALVYRLSKTHSSAYWAKIAETRLTERLLLKLDSFKNRGFIPYYEGETFSPGCWASLFLGSGIWPQRHDPLIHSMNPEWIRQQLEKMQSMMRQAAEQMPLQIDYLQRAQKKTGIN